VALFLVLGLPLFDPRLFTGGDNVVYYLLAKALATGKGYVTLYEPGSPPHTLYPPGYPILLVPVFWLFGGSFWAAKAFSFAAGGAALALAARWLGERLDPRSGGFLVLGFALLLSATNTTFLTYAHWTLTEMPYLPVSIGALILAERSRGGAGTWLGAALLAAGGYLIRTAALPLCAAVTWGVWRTQGRRAGLVTAGVSIAAVAAWTLRNEIVAPGAPGYLNQLLMVDPYDPARGMLTFATFAGRVGENLAGYAFIEIPRLLYPFLPSLESPKLLGMVLGAVLVPLLLYGAVRQVASRGLKAGEVYAALYVGLLAVWPWKGDRFLLPLLPLLLSYLGLGLADLIGARAARRKGRHPAAPHLLAILFGLAVLPNLWHALERIPPQIAVTARHLGGDRLAGYIWYERDYFAAATWLSRNAPPGALVISRKPQFTYLFSGRKSLLYPYGAPEEIERAVARSGASYLIYDNLGQSALIYLRPYLIRHQDDYEIVHSVGQPPTLVLARLGQPAGTPPGRETPRPP
jgi:hypothetical protein